jgi:cysteinyl-tRNA synthetase
MIDIIRTLITKGHAYVAAGEVLFDVAAMADYGKLSGRKLDEQQAGARVAVEDHKKNPADFVLWKLSSAEEPGWDSPWGRGRPGWHIECSAMSKKHLGEVFDIHGGGLDLIFPHHENEIAQSRCAHGTKVMANYWMHNGFLQVEGKKMSKSLGNFVTIADVLKDWPGEVARFNMLRTHYRQPVDWTQSNLEDSRTMLENWRTFLDGDFTVSAPDPEFVEMLADDMNTHAAFTRLHVIAKSKQKSTLHSSLKLVGLDLQKLESAPAINRETVVRLVEDRLVARHQKNWSESDRIRDELAAMGISIKDNKDGTTTWEVKR